jgi:hypothetical protein
LKQRKGSGGLVIAFQPQDPRQAAKVYFDNAHAKEVGAFAF